MTTHPFGGGLPLKFALMGLAPALVLCQRRASYRVRAGLAPALVRWAFANLPGYVGENEYAGLALVLSGIIIMPRIGYGLGLPLPWSAALSAYVAHHIE
jgi:hypothetical protein